jgi:hypothetical protein
MLTEVQVYNFQGSLLTMQLGEISNGIIVKRIEGLDPVKANIVSSSMANMDGAQYQSSRREIRNIVLTLGLEPDYLNEEVADVRKRLYGYFMPNSTVDLRFVMDDGNAFNISGRVETLQTPLFAQEPEVSISIICFDPDFLRSTEDQFADVVFISGNSVSNTLTFNIENPGTVETGIGFHFSPTRNVNEFTLYNEPQNGRLQIMDFSIPLLAFDTLTINTVPGDKSILHYRNNNLLGSALYGLSPQSTWIELAPGDNAFRMFEAGAPLGFFLTHYIRYGGL